MSKNQLDQFESFIKDSLDAQQFEYNPADWNALEKKMDAKTGGPSSGGKSSWIVAAAAIGVTGLSILGYNSLKEENSISEPEKYQTYTSENITKESTPELPKEKKSEEQNLVSQTQKQPSETTNNNNSTELEEPVETTHYSETNGQSSIEETDATVKQSFPLSNENDAEALVTDGSAVEEEIIEEEVFVATPDAAFEIERIEACVGDKIRFKANHEGNVSYNWSFDNGSSSALNSPVVSFNEPGQYEIRLEVVSTINKKISAQTVQTVSILEAPSSAFSFDIGEEFGVPNATFTSDADPTQSVKWSFGDGNFSEEFEPTHIYRAKGDYAVSCTVKDINGCSTTTTENVYIEEDYNLLAPNAFTPNGDDRNDTFIPAALLNFDGTFTMTIYGSKGLIYDTKNASRPWDGVDYTTGELCPQDSYVWVVKLINEKGEPEEYKGSVLLLR